MNKEQKAAVVEELSHELSEADAILAVDYRGISVPQAAELRSGLREAETRFRVVKNRLTLRAADAAGAESLKEHLSGPTALALVKGDVALAAKTISRLGSEWELLTYKGGLMDGEELDGDSFKQIARLPGRDALNAQFAGIVASPLTGLVRGLGSMVQGLASQLQQIADQGLVSGEAPAPATPNSDQAPAEGDEGGAEEGDGAEQPPAEEAGGEQGGEEERGAEASGEGEASAEPGEESSSDSEEEESSADPDPKQSPEETTAEEPGPGEEVPSEEVKQPEETGAPVGEGDAEIGSARGEEPADADTAEQQDGSGDEAEEQQETSEDSDEDKEDQD